MEMLKERDLNQVSLTLKTYETRRGLATRIHATHFDSEKNSMQTRAGGDEIRTDCTYYIKGPMGKGLQIKPTGVHIAFCAGTGVLVFLDLVAHLLVKNCFEADGRKMPAEIAANYQPGFEFHLYVSFQDRESAIGL